MIETKRDEEKQGVGKTEHHSTRFVEPTQIHNSPMAEKWEITHPSQHPKPSKHYRMIERDWPQPMDQ
jgi:hypothetical protein